MPIFLTLGTRLVHTVSFIFLLQFYILILLSHGPHLCVKRYEGSLVYPTHQHELPGSRLAVLDKYAHVFWLHLELVLTSTSVEHGGATLVAPKTMINGIIQELHPFLFRCTPDLFRNCLYCVNRIIIHYIYLQ